MKEPLFESKRWQTTIVSIVVLVLAQFIPFEQFGIERESVTQLVSWVVGLIAAFVISRGIRNTKT